MLIKKKNVRFKKEHIVIFLLFAMATFIFLIKSPMHLWTNYDIGTDSSVFQTIALMMRKGYMPYRDSFDHKGPLLYIINFIGKLISNYHGIWIIEYISLFVTMNILYLIAKSANASCLQSVVSVFVAISLLFSYFNGGNLTEEYAMPFIAIGLYVFIEYMLKDKISIFRLIVCGLCFGAVCLLRANMIGLWIIYCLAIFITCIYKKKFFVLREFIIWFTVGFCLIVIPILIWLWSNNALSDFWFDYIKFNYVYVNSSLRVSAKFIAFFHFSNTFVYTLALVSTVYLSIKKNKYIYGVYFAYLIVTLFLVSMPGKTYAHYGMVLIPAIVFPIASIISYLNEKLVGIGSFLMVTFLLCSVIISNWEYTMVDFVSTYSNRKESNISRDVENLMNVVTENSTDNDFISVYGNYNIIYVLSGRIHATKYSYQFPIGVVYPDIMKEYFEELAEEQPKLIVIQAGRYDDNIIQFLNENDYELLWTSNVDLLNNGTSVFIN